MLTRSSDRRRGRSGRRTFLFNNRIEAFRAAEANLTKALSTVPDHARGHMYFGRVEIYTNRAAEGIAECEHALTLIEFRQRPRHDRIR